MCGVLPGGVFGGAPLTPPRGVVKSTWGNHQLKRQIQSPQSHGLLTDAVLLTKFGRISACTYKQIELVWSAKSDVIGLYLTVSHIKTCPARGPRPVPGKLE